MIIQIEDDVDRCQVQVGDYTNKLNDKRGEEIRASSAQVVRRNHFELRVRLGVHFFELRVDAGVEFFEHEGLADEARISCPLFELVGVH